MAAATGDVPSAPPNARRTEAGMAKDGAANAPKAARLPVRKKFLLFIVFSIR